MTTNEESTLCSPLGPEQLSLILHGANSWSVFRSPPQGGPPPPSRPHQVLCTLQTWQSPLTALVLTVTTSFPCRHSSGQVSSPPPGTMYCIPQRGARPVVARSYLMSDERMETQTLTDFEALLLEGGRGAGGGRPGPSDSRTGFSPDLGVREVWMEWRGARARPGRAHSWAAGLPGGMRWRGLQHLLGWGTLPAWRHANSLGLRTHQSLLDKQAEQDGIAHLPQALEHVGLELCVFDDVLQLVVKELQDPWEVQGEAEWDGPAKLCICNSLCHTHKNSLDQALWPLFSDEAQRG